MKKISLAGVILGMIVALAAILSGSWMFWLGAGLAIGLVLGAAQARRGRRQQTGLRQERDLEHEVCSSANWDVIQRAPCETAETRGVGFRSL